MLINQDVNAPLPRTVGYDQSFFTDSDIAAVVFSGTNATAPSHCRDAAGGGVLLTNGGSDDDACLMACDAEIFRLNQKDGWYSVSFWAAFSDATQSDVFMGLAAGSYTIASPTNDFIGFKKDDGGTALTIRSYKNGAGTDDTLGGAVFTTALCQYRLIIHADPSTLGVATVYAYRDGERLGVIRGCVISDDEEMKWIIGIQNGEGSAKTGTVYRVQVRMPRNLS